VPWLPTGLFLLPPKVASERSHGVLDLPAIVILKHSKSRSAMCLEPKWRSTLRFSFDWKMDDGVHHRNLSSYAGRSMFEKEGRMFFSADLHPIL
jgi:hypothetical protein